jgi:ribosomal protein S12 methylthiotransferase accessory factor
MGMSFSEAYLHGINESIERHYTSYFFEDLVDKKNRYQWKLFCGVNSKRDKIEKKHGRVYTIVAQTKFSTTVALSFLVKSFKVKYLMTPMGAGCSYFSELAIQRSLDELMQCLELYTEEEYAEDKFARDVLNQYSGLKALINISSLQLEELCSEEEFIVEKQKPLSVNNQLVTITDLLEKNSYNVLYRILDDQPESCVVQILIPGFERFHLIRSGQLVIPQSEFKQAVA